MNTSWLSWSFHRIDAGYMHNHYIQIAELQTWDIIQCSTSFILLTLVYAQHQWILQYEADSLSVKPELANRYGLTVSSERQWNSARGSRYFSIHRSVSMIPWRVSWRNAVILVRCFSPTRMLHLNWKKCDVWLHLMSELHTTCQKSIRKEWLLLCNKVHAAWQGKHWHCRCLPRENILVKSVKPSLLIGKSWRSSTRRCCKSRKCCRPESVTSVLLICRWVSAVRCATICMVPSNCTRRTELCTNLRYACQDDLGIIHIWCISCPGSDLMVHNQCPLAVMWMQTHAFWCWCYACVSHHWKTVCPGYILKFHLCRLDNGKVAWDISCPQSHLAVNRSSQRPSRTLIVYSKNQIQSHWVRHAFYCLGVRSPTGCDWKCNWSVMYALIHAFLVFKADPIWNIIRAKLIMRGPATYPEIEDQKCQDQYGNCSYFQLGLLARGVSTGCTWDTKSVF